MKATVTLIGRLGRDPEMRFTSNGKPVTSFSMATDDKYIKDGERQIETTWWKVTTWGTQAENCNQYLAKGRLVYVVGKPKLSRWTAQDGSEKVDLECNASEVLFLEKPPKEIELPE